jgi:hypothetical protein
MDEGIRAGLIETPRDAGLRDFGLIVGSVLIGLFGVVRPLIRHTSSPILPWILGALLVGCALVFPKLLYYPYYWWTLLGRALGWLNSRIVLNLLFFLVFAPAATIARLFDWDPMARRREPNRATYRTSSVPVPADAMEKPY